MDSEEQEKVKIEEGVTPIWCVVANVVLERPYGPGGKETRRGTKHFRPGAKVICVQFKPRTTWVVGRHRTSNRFFVIAMPIEHLTNWRIELVYSPHIIEMVRDYWKTSQWRVTLIEDQETKDKAEKLLSTWIPEEQRVRTQPYVSTRGPREESTD